MKIVCAKLVPKMLTDNQKENPMPVSQDLLVHVQGEPNFLENVIMGDERWVFSTIWKQNTKKFGMLASPCPKEVCMRKSRVKAMLIVLFDSKGLVHMSLYLRGKPSMVLFMWMCSKG